MVLVGSEGVALLGSVILLKKVSLVRGYEVSKTQARPSVILFLLPDDPDVELSASFPAPCLPTCCHVSFHGDIMD